MRLEDLKVFMNSQASRIFENVLLENYKAADSEVEKVKSISIQQINEKFDCTVLSGPHNDKTGPCYCVDDHDHHIQILYTSDILEAFRDEKATVAIMNTYILESEWEDYLTNPDVFVYEFDPNPQSDACSTSGIYSLVIVRGDGAGPFIEEVLDANDKIARHNSEDKCYVIAVTDDLAAELNYEVDGYDLGYIVVSNDCIKKLIDQKEVTLPSVIWHSNKYVLEGINRSDRFIRVTE